MRSSDNLPISQAHRLQAVQSIQHLMLCCVAIALTVQVLTSNVAAASATVGGDFALTDQHGRAFTLQQLRGRPVILLFGFTSCPDVCPIELTTVASALAQASQSNPAAVFVTIDPERDTPQRLQDYVGFFDPQIFALSGSAQAIRQVADLYRVRYSRHGNDDAYTMDHTSTIFVLDKNGVVQSLSPFGVNAEQLAKILNHLAQVPADH